MKSNEQEKEEGKFPSDPVQKPPIAIPTCVFLPHDQSAAFTVDHVIINVGFKRAHAEQMNMCKALFQPFLYKQQGGSTITMTVTSNIPGHWPKGSSYDYGNASTGVALTFYPGPHAKGQLAVFAIEFYIDGTPTFIQGQAPWLEGNKMILKCYLP